ncbi:MAG TPA: hypothetical protein VIV60_08375 [Polyangiaceae bacterium]
MSLLLHTISVLVPDEPPFAEPEVPPTLLDPPAEVLLLVPPAALVVPLVFELPPDDVAEVVLDPPAALLLEDELVPPELLLELPPELLLDVLLELVLEPPEFESLLVLDDWVAPPLLLLVWLEPPLPLLPPTDVSAGAGSLLHAAASSIPEANETFLITRYIDIGVLRQALYACSFQLGWALHRPK